MTSTPLPVNSSNPSISRHSDRHESAELAIFESEVYKCCLSSLTLFTEGGRGRRYFAVLNGERRDSLTRLEVGIVGSTMIQER